MLTNKQTYTHTYLLHQAKIMKSAHLEDVNLSFLFSSK